MTVLIFHRHQNHHFEPINIRENSEERGDTRYDKLVWHAAVPNSVFKMNWNTVKHVS